MGKRMIFNGVDFSENAIVDFLYELDVTALMPDIYLGASTDMSSSTNAEQVFISRTDRETTDGYLDVSTLKNKYGFKYVRCEIVDDSYAAVPGVIEDTNSAASWSDVKWPLGDHTNITVNIKLVSGGIPSETDLSKICKVYLSIN